MKSALARDLNQELRTDYAMKFYPQRAEADGGIEEQKADRLLSGLSIDGHESQSGVENKRISTRSIRKRLFDIVGALLIGVACSPVIVFVTLALACGRGKVLFRHQRVGLNGHNFDCLKFQTMVPNADEVLNHLLATNPLARAEWNRDHKLRNDPRITRIGKFLRRTSLDELPQLWNVLRGDMSLVGPRPIVVAEFEKYRRYIADYLEVKPGLTGIWQVSGRNLTSYRRRIAMDVFYIRNASLTLDLYILAMTVRVVLLRHGAY